MTILHLWGKPYQCEHLLPKEDRLGYYNLWYASAALNSGQDQRGCRSHSLNVLNQHLLSAGPHLLLYGLGQLAPSAWHSRESSRVGMLLSQWGGLTAAGSCTLDSISRIKRAQYLMQGKNKLAHKLNRILETRIQQSLTVLTVSCVAFCSLRILKD